MHVTQRTRDLWFYAALALSLVGVARVLAAYLYVLLLASVVVVVCWPLHRRIKRACGERSGLAAALTVVVLSVAVVLPFGLLAYLFVGEAIQVAELGVAYLKSGELNRWVDANTRTVTWLPGWIQAWLPAGFDLQTAITGPTQRALLSLFTKVGNGLPQIVGSTVGFGVDLVVFAMSVVALLVEGPRVIRAAKRLIPLDDAYEDRLMAVFAEFAHNLVLGTLVTATIQGLLAGVGYAIVGVDRVVFFAILTGCFGLVPLLGTTVVFVPLAAAVWFDRGLAPALFLLGWGVGVGQIDNILRPLLMRGSSEVHPVLILLAAFGGIAWLGVPGILVGPVIVAIAMTLYRIYASDFLGVRPVPLPARRGLITALTRPDAPIDEEPRPRPPAPDPSPTA